MTDRKNRGVHWRLANRSPQAPHDVHEAMGQALCRFALSTSKIGRHAGDDMADPLEALRQTLVAVRQDRASRDENNPNRCHCCTRTKIMSIQLLFLGTLSLVKSGWCSARRAARSAPRF